MIKIDEYIKSLLERRAGSSAPEGAWSALADSLIGPEVALLASKLFRPDLIEVDGFVLIHEYYDHEYYSKVISDYGRDLVEKTINTCYLYNLVGQVDADEQAWNTLGSLLSDSWVKHATEQFPGRQFHAEFIWLSDIDPAVVLYQIPITSNR